MSVLDPIRLYFRGKGSVNRPTQNRNRNGEVDFPTSTVFVDGVPIHDDAPPALYHQHLAATGRRYGPDGWPNPEGTFSENTGWNAGGSGHFIWRDTRIVAVQSERGRVDRTDDSLLGALVEIWGHYNEYLRTTANRARFLDVDPTSRWTPHVAIGQFTFGRRAPSVESPNLFSADVEGAHGACWLRTNAFLAFENHVEHSDLTTAMTFNFVIHKPGAGPAVQGRHFTWHESARDSAALRVLQRALEAPDAIGLAVQYTLLGMAPPEQPETPALHELFGTIGVARAHESPTRPPGRLLVPLRRATGAGHRLGPASVSVEEGWATFNLPATIPFTVEGAEPVPVQIEPLELVLGNTQKRLAVLEPADVGAETLMQGSIVDRPLEVPWSDALNAEIAEQGLILRSVVSGEIVMRERELLVNADVVNLILDHPDRRRGLDHAQSVRLCSFVRGRRAPAGPIRLRNVVNPTFRAMHLREEMEREAAGREYPIVEPCSSTRALDTDAIGPVLHTDANGHAILTLRGVRPGSARLWLATAEDDDVADLPTRATTLSARYDDADVTGFWSTANVLNVRVLADDWDLLDVSPSRVDYRYLYRKGLMIYELLYPYMGMNVFSLADEPKFETYARLMYQMCDRANRNKTYYMPPTRDMTPAQTQLLFSYMGNVAEMNAHAFDNPVVSAPETPARPLGEVRDEVTQLLRRAVELEMSLMLQYLYAGYSVPNRKTASELVRRGRWTAEQLVLACGDGTERPRQGWRGTLLEIAQEEMIHFHAVTNLLMAVGAEFYVPVIDWPGASAELPLGAEMALAPFSLPALARFVHFEEPASERAIALAGVSARLSSDGRAFHSVSELYARIRHLIETTPGLIQGRSTSLGREHHLFISERLNQRHPDFQMQVWSRETALLTIDFLVSQGEGRLDVALDAPDAHYHRLRRILVEFAEELGATAGGPWSPAYPVLRNPTLHANEAGWQEIRDPAARAVAEVNEECFALMLILMARHHVDIPDASFRRSRLMNASIDVMTGMVRPLSILLMSMPSGVGAYTAGPTFRAAGSQEPLANLTTREALAEFSTRFGKLRQRSAAIQAMPRAVLGMMAFYESYFDELAEREALSLTTG